MVVGIAVTIIILMFIMVMTVADGSDYDSDVTRNIAIRMTKMLIMLINFPATSCG